MSLREGWVHPSVAKEDAKGFDLVHVQGSWGGPWKWCGDKSRPVHVARWCLRKLGFKDDEIPETIVLSPFKLRFVREDGQNYLGDNSYVYEFVEEIASDA